MQRSVLLAIVLTISLVAIAGAEVAAGAAAWPMPDWQTATPESQGLSADGIAAVQKWHAENASRTGLVIRHGRIVGEWYFGDTNAATKLAAFSTTKSFSSTAAGMAIGEKKFSLDTPLGQFLPDAEPAEKKQVTVGQLLSMTSGVENNPALGSQTDLFAFATREAKMEARPGERWNYNNTGLALLSPLFRAATGETIDRYLDARVFRPIGITPDDWSWEQNAGYPLPFSGLHITARALGRFGLLVLREGHWQERQIVPADWLATAVRPSQSLEKSYSYLWWNNTAGRWPGVPADAFAAIGFLDNDLLIVPSLDLIVIRQVGDKPLHDRAIKIDELFRLSAAACQTEPAPK